MKCPKCGYVTFDYLERCKRCGADFVSEQALPIIEMSPSSLGGGQGTSVVTGERKSTVDLGRLLDQEFDQIYERLKGAEEDTNGVRWGGFFRRACAFSVDILVLLLLSFFLFYFAYVGYSVGLAAHHRSLSTDDLSMFLRILLFAWFSLVGGYFVLFHGMEGKTVGKWLFGLRVVGANQEPIKYSQAFVRWIGTLFCVLFGTGFLWILLNREKRGWHDLLARTWVVQERSPTSLKG